MKEEVVMEIFRSLRSPADFWKFEMSPGALSSLLIQKGIREAKKSAGIVKAREREVIRSWKGGQSFLQIGRRYGVLPLSVAYAMRSAMGFNKKEFARMIRGENGNLRGFAVRVERELREACKYDYMHSPKALAYMRDQGKHGEAIAEKILAMHKIKSCKECDQPRKPGSKTPDFLFEKREKLFGHDVFWLESKATFGRLTEARSDWNSQIKHYVELFGPGIIVYWFGYTDKGKEIFENVFVYSGSDLRKYAEKELDELEQHGLRL